MTLTLRFARTLTAVTVLLAMMLGVVAAADATTSTSADARSHSDDVRPIDWSRLRTDSPADPASTRIRQILANSNTHTLTTWWELQGYDEQSGDYLDPLGRGGTTAATYHGFSLAVSLATGAYNSDRTGLSENEALDRTLKLVRTVALRHRANTPGGWGNGWQDPSFAGYAGWAGWLLWDELSDAERQHIQRMVEYQANSLRDDEVGYYRNRSGDIVNPGDTLTDNNSWRSMVLTLATAMMPQHESWDMWMDKNLEFMLSVTARPADATDAGTVVNGKLLSEWLNGSNIESDGTVVNHNIIHPDYMTSFKLNFMAPAAYTLAGKPTPKAAFHNADRIYEAYSDLEFASPPFDAPGGTIYIDGSDEIYYPEGTDWSPSRRMIFAETDVQVAAFGLDGRASTPAAESEALHADAAFAQQQRHPDGRMYAPGEHTSEGLDNAVAPARAYLTKWITHQDLTQITNRAYRHNHADLGFEATPEEIFLAKGDSTDLTMTVANNGSGAATHAELDLEFLGQEPDGLHVERTAGLSRTTIPEGGSRTWSWTVSADADAAAGQHRVQAVVKYRGPGRWVETSAPVTIGVETQVVDDADPKVDYSGRWRSYADSNYVNGTLMSGREVGASVTVEFTGTRAEYVALTSRYNAYGDVYLDGVFQETADFYSTSAGYRQVVYDTGPLPRGEHVITVVNSEQEHGNALSPYINFDALNVYLNS